MELMKNIREAVIEKRLQRLRKSLHNMTPTILSNNCNGTFMYHDLHLKFNSPTINLFFSIQDFIRFVRNLDYYLGLELRQYVTDEYTYPVGRLGEITIHFMHYDNFGEAAVKWYERVKRIDKDNLYIVMNEGRGCTYEDLVEFDALPFSHKVVFTHKEYGEIKSAYYITGFEDKESCDFLFEYRKSSIERYYEQFDYVSFLNQN